MKSVRWNELKKTFRFRLAILYMLMVSVALTITFVIALLLARGSAAGFARTEMEVALHAAQTAYLGKHEENARQLPEELMERVGHQFPNIHIGLVEQEVQPGGILFEIIASSGDMWLEILADPDGDVWLADSKPMQEVFAGIEESVRMGGNSRLSVFICASDGTLLAGSRSATEMDCVSQLRIQSAGSRIMRDGDDLYGGVVLFDGNHLYAVRDMEEMEQVTVWAFEFFVLLIVVFIPLAGGIGFVVSRKAMAGVQRVTDAADRVRTGNFKERVEVVSEGTEIKELTEAFNAMVSRIDGLMRELRDVTANIAHDLKTPVMRIRGTLESMNWEEVSSDEREHLMASALEECDRIMPMIESILELSLAEAGMLVLQREPLDLAAEIRAAHDMFSTVAEDRRITFTCRVPDTSVSLIGDRSRMQRVIANLIDNALKFTQEGGYVSIQLQVSGSQAELIVSDNGPGIPQNELENVFKRFYRLDPSRGTSGHGMGLSLVRAFVNAFGGTVSIASDGGCHVTVTLPLKPD